jgi:hypothetical protein
MSGSNPGANPPGNHTCPGCMVSDPGGGGVPPELSLALQFLHAREHDRDASQAAATTVPEDAGLRAAIENLLVTYGAVLKARAAAVDAVAAVFRT